MSRRPVIGVTGPDSGGWVAWRLTSFAISRAGGKAIRIRPSHPRSSIVLDGLVVGGGADVDPALYNQERVLPQIRREGKRELLKSIPEFILMVALWLLRRLFSSPWRQTEDKARDRLESDLISELMSRGRPILGICRGMQLLNVQFGGSLHQDITEFYAETPQLRTVLPKKKIEIAPGSKLHRILGRTMTRVNSLHRQSVRDLGAGLRISAVEPNGVVQAIEHRELPFVIGVQWHPEFLPQDEGQLALFRSLVDTARLGNRHPERRPAFPDRHRQL